MKAARTFDGSKGANFYTWLLKNIRLALRSWRSSLKRKAGRRPPHQSLDVGRLDVVDGRVGADAAAEIANTKVRLWRHLNARQRSVLDLKLAGHTHREIGVHLGLSKSQVLAAIEGAYLILRRIDPAQSA